MESNFKLWLTLSNKAIRRWLKYRVHRLNSRLKPSMDPEKNPYAGLLAKLSGVEPPKKRARQAFQQYMHESLDKLKPLFDAAWEEKKKAGLQASDRNDATFRANIAREEFSKLSATEKKQYEANAQAEKLRDAERYEAALKAAMAKTPANRLRCVQSL